MRHNVQILSIKKNVINIKFRKEMNSRLILFCIGFIAIFMLSFSFGGSTVKEVGSGMMYIYNPVNSLYNDNSSIIFTSVNAVTKDKLNFILPITGADVSLEPSGNIRLLVKNSIMVKSIENGVVDDVGATIDGIKYIKIYHTINIFSIIENVDMIGVSKGETIKKGQDIATAKEGNYVILRIFDGDNQLTNLKINQSKIICEN